MTTNRRTVVRGSGAAALLAPKIAMDRGAVAAEPPPTFARRT